MAIWPAQSLLNYRLFFSFLFSTFTQPKRRIKMAAMMLSLPTKIISLRSMNLLFNQRRGMFIIIPT